MFIYDTGALVAAERGDKRMARTHARALAAGVRPIVPAPVLAQAWRGGPQPLLSRTLRGCRIVTMDEEMARAVGALLAKAAAKDVVDGAVVLIAGRHPGVVVVTSDPADLRRLAVANGSGVRLLTV
jgi:hypothetical protein